MADNATPRMPDLPDPDIAYAHILYNVHAPHFFAKLAELGHRPANEKEAQALLELGFMLKAAEAQLASAQGPYSAAASSLRRTLGVSEAPSAEKAAQTNALQAAAAQTLQDPTNYLAALALLKAGGVA